MELRLALPQEVEADERVRSLANSTPEGRWLAFKAEEPLPADTAISVTIGPDTPSAEGPLTQPQSYSFGFQTYAPLRIAEHYCGWQGSDCPPGMPFIIRFNNPLDMDAFREDLLVIEPALPGATINVYGDIISIQGATQGRTSYSVTVSGELRDAFGQTLGRDERVTFKVGRAVPRLSGPNSNFVTLDPSQAKPVFSVYTINYPRLWVQVYAVTPQDWPAYQDYLQRYNWEDKDAQPPGELLLDKRLPVESAEDQLVEFPVDLSPYMDGTSGHFIIIIQPPNPSQDDFWQAVRAWVQVTDLGIDAYTDSDQMLAWVTDLQSGAPLTGVTIQPAGPTDAGWPAQRTAEDGTVGFPLPSGASYLIASKDADQAILPRSTYYSYDDGWQVRPSTDELRWYLFDDRGMYRPGETVHLKGWLRKIEGGSQGDVAIPGEGTSVVSYTVYDAQGVQIGSGETPVNGLGGFDFAIELPEALNLGPARLDLFTGGSPGGSFYHSFQVQEFRRPEFEVTARNETPPPYFAGGSATVAVLAKYYAGDPLPNAEVTWQVTYSPGSYSPPGWPEFTFGEWLPWWWAYDYEGMRGFPIEEGGESLIFNGLTDAAGEHYLELDFPGRRVKAGQRARRSQRHGRQPPGLDGWHQFTGAPGQPVRWPAQRAVLRR